MSKFQKKPIIVEATQWFPGQNQDLGVYKDYLGKYTIITLEGPMIVTPGDYIITGVKGEKYPCKADIFKLTYEPVTNPRISIDPFVCPTCKVRLELDIYKKPE